LRITRIETILLKCEEGVLASRPTASFVYTGSVILKVLTDEGIVGIGEPSPYGGPIKDTVKYIEEFISPQFVGLDPLKCVNYTRQSEWPKEIRPGNTVRNAVIAGMSQAIWDIVGKAYGKPIYRLLNPDASTNHRVKAYASGGMWTDIQEPQALIDEVLEIQSAGYTAWKFRPEVNLDVPHYERNRNPPEVDIKGFLKVAEKIRTAVGGSMDLMVDAGCRLGNANTAEHVASVLYELGFLFLEEPLPRISSMYAHLRSVTQLPIAGGECMASVEQFQEWVDSGAFDVLQPDANMAGIQEIRAIATLANHKHLDLVLHNWTHDVCNAANVQIGAALPNCSMVEFNVTHNPLRSKLVNESFSPIEGYFVMNDKPGLGVELDDDVVNQYSYQ
jgi:L-alanine-DL-glutamate epimerase-like enolase superfamily enzyme